ncbi:hypothetical protein [Paraburkholderia sp. BL21I4N1]|uniref:hypothetical protein n=1 Tax=Paraburkholderia sp. BL21I4N1 TaxID=1938801 RepID=UPI000CFB39B8|nr:hypothetical protein [Paraburkholderia sp. BL21I4N1]PQV52448.1 hypothetical protein B0G83_103197 [Paraburkholderia sp. BL21I4N1]
MNNSLRQSATCLFLALAASAVPAFALAQNNPAQPAPAANAGTTYGTLPRAPVDRRAKQRTSEQTLLGAPRPYGTADMQQGDTDDAQRTALLNEQRMTVLGGGQGAQPALGKGKGNGKAPAPGTAQLRVADQAGPQLKAADGLTQEGAVRNTYADPYATGKHAVYRSPW